MNNQSKSGFTLLEVLIAMLILSFGLLGLASLQMFGLRNNQSAYFRTQATQLAYDMADRMRANTIAVSNNQYNNQAETTDNCVTNFCTPAQMAGYDIAQWNSALVNSGLPGVVGIVCRDSTPADGSSTAPACDNTGNTYAIKIWWDDDRSGNLQRFVMSFQP